MRKFDYIIVGQGIAGTTLSYELLRRGHTVCVVDKGIEGSSSYIAGGVINPITGRNYVKSWRIDDFLPEAMTFYTDVGKLLKSEVPYYRPMDIWWFLKDVQKENNWLTKACSPAHEQYMLARPFEEDVSYIQEGHTYGIYKVQGGGRVDSVRLLSDYRHYLSENGSLLEADFQIDKATISDTIQFQDIHAEHIIFCDGYRSYQNPYFENLPFRITQGEFFILHIPDLEVDAMIKLKQTLIPLGNSNYWYGATYDWDADPSKPLVKVEKDFLLKGLNQVLSVPYEIVHHKVGLRPTTVDRRPLLKQSQTQSNVYLFNGMGSKGFSQAPLLAKEFVDAFFTS